MATELSHSEWWTPKALVDVVNREFNFDLDAAATNRNKIAERWIGPIDDSTTTGMESRLGEDALVTPWEGRAVWCNPPYGRGLVSSLPDFIQRGYEQHLEQQNTVVMLLPAYTDPKYWSMYCTKAHEIRLLTGRLAFLDSGVSKMSARFPSALVIFKWFPGVCHKGAHIWSWEWRAA